MAAASSEVKSLQGLDFGRMSQNWSRDGPQMVPRCQWSRQMLARQMSKVRCHHSFLTSDGTEVDAGILVALVARGIVCISQRLS